jgi:hypothetical protein
MMILLVLPCGFDVKPFGSVECSSDLDGFSVRRKLAMFLNGTH